MALEWTREPLDYDQIIANDMSWLFGLCLILFWLFICIRFGYAYCLWEVEFEPLCEEAIGFEATALAVTSS